MAIFPTSGENSNSCEISHFPVSKQTVKVEFSLDVLGNSGYIYSGIIIPVNVTGKYSKSSFKIRRWVALLSIQSGAF